MTVDINRLLDRLIQIQQIPSPTFGEEKRAEFVRRSFESEGLSDVHVDQAGNVLARLIGSGQGKPLVVSAHLDTVFSTDIDLTYRKESGRIYGPGIGDNSLGVAGLFGLIWILRDRSITLPGDLWLAANTGEEGLGDLRGMRAIVDRFAEQPVIYLVLEGIAYGHIYHRGISVRRYRISAQVEGGHSWNDYGKPSAIHVLSKLVTDITRLNLPTSPRTTLNVGRMSGGTSINTIAASAWLELDMRSENPMSLSELVTQVDGLIKSENRSGISMTVETIGDRPGGEIPVDHPLVELAQVCLREQGVEPGLTTGSTDANMPLSRGYPSLVLGITRGGAAHTVHEYIETEPVEAGMEQIVKFIQRVWTN